MTYLGIALRSLSPELTAQVGLPEGFGLLVAEIMDGSPAKEAGFQKYDVLVMIGDQRIVNAAQFQALIRSQKKGDEVTITVRRRGAETKVSARLGEHAFQEIAGHHAHPPMSPMGRGERPDAKMFNRNLPDPKQRIGEVKERMEHMREMVRERIQNRGTGDGRPGPVPPPPGVAPMKRDGDRDGPHSPPRGGPPATHRDGDRDAPPGPRADGPRSNAEPHRDGGRPAGEQHGDRGPRPNAEAHRDGNRPGGDQHGDRGPHADGPPGRGPRPDADAHRDGNRPGGEQHGDRGPRPDGPPGHGPRPDADAHRDGKRPGGEQRGDRGPREDGPRPDGPPAGGPRPDAPRTDAPGSKA